MPFDCVVVGSHLRYDGVRQRPHHIASRLAVRAPLLYVEEPFAAQYDDDRIERRGALEVLRPLRRDLGAEPFDERTIAAVRAWVGTRRPLVWLYTPLASALAGAIEPAAVVYDRMDDLAAFASAPPGLAERERRLLERADAVFAGGASLYDGVRWAGPKVRLEPSGVDYEHFARARDLAPHPLFAHLSGPVCGYAGVLDERIDFALIAALAEAGFEVVMIGPVTKIDGSAFPRRPHVHFTGAVPYADLPRFLAGFDVALLPFARNAATATISPTKTPEYFAAGLPVVSTPIADVVRTYGDAALIAEGAPAFVRAAQAARIPDAARAERGEHLARAASWDAIVARMVEVAGGE